MCTSSSTPAASLPGTGLLLAAALAALFCSACRVGYVLRSGYHQAALLAGRRPIERVLAEETVTGLEAERLRLVPRIKAWGVEQGLEGTRSYTAYTPGWQRKVFNLTACPPLSLEPRTWWFPVVGRVPYLGFFQKEHALREARKLRSQGYETWIREVSAWSTLGWFRDPVLPAMLRWDEARLAQTLLHEMAHATLWIPGDVPFNEGFASVVGTHAATGWLKDHHGPHSAEVRAHLHRQADAAVFRRLLAALFENLDRLYRNPDGPDERKHRAKALLFEEFAEAVQEAPLHDPARLSALVSEEPWNNARLLQYHIYDRDRALLERFWEHLGGDLPAFLETTARTVAHEPDPRAAIRGFMAGDGASETP